MKKLLSLICAVLLAAMLMPSFTVNAEAELIPAATTARTTLLDLSTTTSSTSSTAQGWAFNPRGNGSYPVLTLNSYGSATAHSAPILVPANTTIVVNGECYIDNVHMGEKYNDITALCNGYLHIEGEGTLNLYANQYQGRCISKESGSTSNSNDDLVIEGVTVNCYNTPHDMYTAFSNEDCIYAYKSIIIRNSVIFAQYGRYGIRIWGETPIGGVTEENADEILIEDSTVTIENQVEDNGKQYENGIVSRYGRIRIVGDSHISIAAGHDSIYAYLSLVLDGGTLDVASRPVGSGEAYPLVTCDRLVVNNGVSHVKIAATQWPLTCILKCKSDGSSVLGDELVMKQGSFENGNYIPGTIESSGLPVLEIGKDSVDILLGDANCDGVVDFSDAAAIAAYVMMGYGLSPQGILNADVNQDGSVTGADITALFNLIFG